MALYSGAGGGGVGYIRDVNWVIYLGGGGVYSGDLYTVGVLTTFYGILLSRGTSINILLLIYFLSIFLGLFYL